MRLLLRLIPALVLWRDGSAAGEGRAVHIDDGTFSARDHGGQEPFQKQQQQQVLDHSSDSAFNLKVQVNDMLSRQYLSQAVVEVYINYTRTNTGLTGEDGGVLLHVPYQTELPVVVVASRDGYICTLLPCKTRRTPIFSSVTMSLLGLNQGNIWLFEDSVLITDKTSGASSQPLVQFPKSLLNLTDSRNITSVKAYLSIPSLSSEGDSFRNTLGIVSSKSGYVSVELSPLAAVSVQLFSGDTELHVSGPIQISVSVTDNCGLQTSDVVPAWFFNRTTGGDILVFLIPHGEAGTLIIYGHPYRTLLSSVSVSYVHSTRHRLCSQRSVEVDRWVDEKRTGKGGIRRWKTHVDIHSSSPRLLDRSTFTSYQRLNIPADFILQHSSFLVVLLGGLLLIIICLLVALLRHRRSSSGPKAKQMPAVIGKDQTTCTCDDEVFELSSGDTSYPKEGSSVIANPNAVAIMLESSDRELNTDLNDLMRLHKTTEQMRLSPTLTENLYFYNQPVAILHAPAFFHLEEQPEKHQRSRSATLPRTGASNSADTEPLNEDNFTQTLSRGPSLIQNQTTETEDQLGVLEGCRAATSTSASRGHFNLPESMSVPGTLNKIRHNRHSLHALAELSNIPSTQAPRAWFVSLEGKPAAEIHYAVSEQQRRRRPVESRETSLDSGVDMSELNQWSGRRTVTLERNATFVKSTSSSKHVPPQ